MGTLIETLRLVRRRFWVPPEGMKGISELGYQGYVGGLWEEIGSLQFEFLVAQGLKPCHVLVDIACGAFRGGRYFIRYLNPGNYLGVEKEAALVEAGRAHEISPDVWTHKRPEILISGAFEFHKLSKHPDFALAQSLFSHLQPADIRSCLSNLYNAAPAGCRFFATFPETSMPRWRQVLPSHSLRDFYYTRTQMEDFGKEIGWDPRYIGEWNHPRRQKMIEYCKA